MIPHIICFSDGIGNIKWSGKQVSDDIQFTEYLKVRVTSRLFDQEQSNQLEQNMRSFASSDMESDFIKEVLESRPEPKPWEVGEALAECLLEDEYQVTWPWNMERDKRTPKASLQGVDLIGFVTHSDKTYIAVGEVKTSNDANNPPNVMYGREGMTSQLTLTYTDFKIHRSILTWLQARCPETSEHYSLYQRALETYTSSRGKGLSVYGVLVRDTQPHESDVKNRAVSLAETFKNSPNTELIAWYVPEKIDNWCKII